MLSQTQYQDSSGGLSGYGKKWLLIAGVIFFVFLLIILILIIPGVQQSAPDIQSPHTELSAIRHALAYTEGHKGKAAKVLGISRATLYEKLKKLGELDG